MYSKNKPLVGLSLYINQTHYILMKYVDIQGWYSFKNGWWIFKKKQIEPFRMTIRLHKNYVELIEQSGLDHVGVSWDYKFNVSNGATTMGD